MAVDGGDGGYKGEECSIDSNESFVVYSRAPYCMQL